MDSILEILITIVVLGVGIYFLIPFYKQGRDARGKKSIVRGILSTFVYLAYGWGWFYMIFLVPQFMRQYTDSVILSALPVLPMSLLLCLPLIFFFNYLKGAKGKDIFSSNYQEKK
jgi:hypothetical protein